MKCKILVFVVLVVFCITHACEGETVKLKNPAVASGLSFGWTFLPSLPLLYCMATDNEFLPAACVLSFSGFMVGPSTGHFYAENRSWGNKSIGFRSACAGIGLLGGVGVHSIGAMGGDGRLDKGICSFRGCYFWFSLDRYLLLSPSG